MIFIRYDIQRVILFDDTSRLFTKRFRNPHIHRFYKTYIKCKIHQCQKKSFEVICYPFIHTSRIINFVRKFQYFTEIFSLRFLSSRWYWMWYNSSATPNSFWPETTRNKSRAMFSCCLLKIHKNNSNSNQTSFHMFRFSSGLNIQAYNSIIHKNTSESLLDFAGFHPTFSHVFYLSRISHIY